MIDHISGTVSFKDPTRTVIDVHGVGYEIFISLHTFESLPELHAEVMLLTHLHVREDAMLLYGFSTMQERAAFRMLMGVSGVGAKVALSILSGVTVDELREYVSSNNYGALTSIPGIGKKTAERITVELRDKIGKGIAGVSGASGGSVDVRGEAVMALVALGYTQQNAENAIRKALSDPETAKDSVGGLVKTALRLLTK